MHMKEIEPTREEWEDDMEARRWYEEGQKVIDPKEWTAFKEFLCGVEIELVRAQADVAKASKVLGDLKELVETVHLDSEYCAESAIESIGRVLNDIRTIVRTKT